MSNKQIQLKPQDVMVALGILLKCNKSLNYKTISSYLGISQSTCFESISNLVYANLLIKENNKLRIENLKEVLFTGLKYFFPVRPGEITRGVPALSSAPALSDVMDSNESFVWPYDSGKQQGQAIIPLYPSIPKISLGDKELWNLFTFTDCLRCGNAREKMQAAAYFQVLIAKYEKQ